MPKKLSRRDVEQGLKTVPIDVVLLGAAGASTTKLTAKQRNFAEGIAMGKTKAGAYRDAYRSSAKPHHQSLEGQRLAAHPAIARQIDAFRLAAEARKHATPAALRQLVIERLTAHAIDDDLPPAQRLRALELLGKVTEVAAFTERREIIKSTDAGQAKAALLESLKLALRATTIDAEVITPKDRKGNSVTHAAGSPPAGTSDHPGGDPGRADEAAQAEPTAPAPPDAAERAAPHLHSIPHIRSSPDSVLAQDPSMFGGGVENAAGTQPAIESGTRVTPVTLPRVNPDVKGGEVLGETLSRVTPVTLARVNPEGGEKVGGLGGGEGVGGVPGGNWK